ncbi:ribulose-phosphate 3-epimerase [uncultured Lactobacillus sp.]|uniref:ribulose-phosphate 3-epimerase n=1 Tax=uncultured Lactobacillus sp. TaxID=153152 RepID=UPI00262D476C|nr:ribulose-phosphate 3-epimerase [uncultured Lactobacillus sp.]
MIAPSILNANNMKLGQDIDEAIESGIERFHIDIMDGHFVPNLSYGPELIKDFKLANPLTEAEVHLMSDNLETTLPLFVDAGCDILEFHIEATDRVDYWLDYLHKHKVRAGIAINPDTPLEKIKPYLNEINQLLIMTVKPGFGGQEFHEDSPERIKQAKKLIMQANKNIPIEVDGGIDNRTAQLAKKAGAEIFVSGSYIFKQGVIPDQINTLNEALK